MTLPTQKTRLTGFGMASCAEEWLVRPTSVETIQEAFVLGRPITLRGSGLSYGDANIGEGCIGLDISGMNRVISWDPQTGVIECEAGVTIEQVWRTSLPDGWWPPVVSGTMFPTLGGALAMNIHGKNNSHSGTLGEHVLELDFLSPNGELTTLTPADDLFCSAISSAGLLGVITRVRLQLKKLRSGLLKVEAFSCGSLGEAMALLQRDSEYRVGWIDCFSDQGRGEIHLADYIDGPPESLRLENQDLPKAILGVPKSSLWRFARFLTNDTGMGMVNRAKYRGSQRNHGKTYDQSLVAFNFLLDYMPNWRKAYLPAGFIQYQSFVPKESAERVFLGQLRMQREAGMPSYLGVLKRHRPDCFIFSHAVDGYSLALDFKVKDWPKLRELCWRMNDLVLEAGGRFYFAKDSTLRPSDARAYLGRSIDTYRQLKAKFDPAGLLTSDLARRLDLARPMEATS